VYLSPFLINSFELNDLRKIKWTNSVTINGTTYNYPYKYKSAVNGSPVSEYLMVLRLAEQYLIRSEARAQQNKINEAKSDLNLVRARAGLPNTTANDKLSLLSAILNERQIELFTEWGQRWFDIKRNSSVDSIMTIVTPQKGGTWTSYSQWYPIPYSDIFNDPNISQNAGY